MIQFIGLGNVTRDLKTSESGKMAYTTLAVTTSDRDEDGKYKSTFVPLRFLGEKAVENATKCLEKGSRIMVTGEPRYDSSKDEDGNYKNNPYVIVRTWEFAGSKKDKADKKEDDPVAETTTEPDDLPF